MPAYLEDCWHIIRNYQSKRSRCRKIAQDKCLRNKPRTNEKPAGRRRQAYIMSQPDKFFTPTPELMPKRWVLHVLFSDIQKQQFPQRPSQLR